MEIEAGQGKAGCTNPLASLPLSSLPLSLSLPLLPLPSFSFSHSPSVSLSLLFSLSSIFSVTYNSFPLVILLSSTTILLRKIMYLSIFKGNMIEIQSLALAFIGYMVTSKSIHFPELCL